MKDRWKRELKTKETSQKGKNATERMEQHFQDFEVRDSQDLASPISKT